MWVCNLTGWGYDSTASRLVVASTSQVEVRHDARGKCNGWHLAWVKVREGGRALWTSRGRAPC